MKARPYTFPHKSRAAMAEYLTRRGRSYHYQRYAFAWCVKTHAAEFDGDTLRRHVPGLNPAEDSAWWSLLENDRGDLFSTFCEDAARGLSEGEWCSYPGDDQGDWDFSFAGRSGGWLVLEKWRGRDMRDVDAADFLDRDLWPWADLVAFYRGIRCADSDFTEAKAAAEVEYMAAFYRDQWEDARAEDRAAEAEAQACRMAAARPDLAPCYA
jgi:hypothetical protein